MSAHDGAESEQTIADVMASLALGGGRRRRKSDVDEPEAEPDWPDGEVAERAERVLDPVGQVSAAGQDADPDASIVRPYAWTRGRTRSNFEMRVETMVSTSDGSPDAGAFAESEHRAIGALCHEPRSVAEVATLLGAPLGVAKVLLGDMAQLGLVTVHKTATGGANRAHLVLMERVLSGLRRL